MVQRKEIGIHSYDENTIEHKDAISIIRFRPSMYINDTGTGGHFHILKELIDNSLDEIENFEPSTKLVVVITRCQEANDYIAIVLDTGRGLPFTKIKDIYTQLHTSGKYNSNAYKFSSGLFGVGSTVTFSLSKQFCAISVREGKYASFCANYTNYHSVDVMTDVNTLHEKFQHGTIAIYSPDNNILTEADKFISNAPEGYRQVITLFKAINYFHDYQLFLYTIDLDEVKYKKMYNDMFNSPTNTVIESILLLIDNLVPEYTPIAQYDTGFLLEFFNIPTLEPVFEIKTFTDNLYVDIKLFVDNFRSVNNNNVLSLINNVLFTNINDVHIRVLNNTFKSNLIRYIKDQNVKKFFKEKYTFPFYYVCDVKFKGAEFTGTTKNKFNDKKFEKKFNEFLAQWVVENSQLLVHVFNILEKDIYTKYKNASSIKVSSIKNKKLISLLNYPGNFADCQDYTNAELFICEGSSAKRDEARDSRFQALYALRGKPYNAIDSKDKLDKSLHKLLNSKIFQDVFTLLGISPNDTDLENKLRFKKVFIMADADEYGKSITNLLIGNMYAYNPLLLEKGHVFVVIPPKYKLEFNKKNVIYVRSDKEYIASLVVNLYSRLLDIFVQSVNGNKDMKRLDIEEMSYFVSIVFDFCTTLEDYAKTFNIDNIAIFEAVIRNFELLDNIEPNLDKLRMLFDTQIVKYNTKEDSILFSYQDGTDIYIPLAQIRDVVSYYLVPMYNKYGFKYLNIYIRFKGSDKMIQLSVSQLYSILKSLNDKIKITRFKGLGDMELEELYGTCIDPATRTVYQITEVSNVDRIFELLGSDSSFRKQLVTW